MAQESMTPGSTYTTLLTPSGGSARMCVCAYILKKKTLVSQRDRMKGWAVLTFQRYINTHFNHIIVEYKEAPVI